MHVILFALTLCPILFAVIASSIVACIVIGENDPDKAEYIWQAVGAWGFLLSYVSVVIVVYGKEMLREIRGFYHREPLSHVDFEKPPERDGMSR